MRLAICGASRSKSFRARCRSLDRASTSHGGARRRRHHPISVSRIGRSMTSVRVGEDGDAEAIRQAMVAAFGGTLEADLVDLLRDRGKLLVSMVAQSDSAIVGHIAFSRVVIESHAGLRGVGLAPMGVLPPMQRHGIGSALVQAGLDRCDGLQFEFAVVLGYAAFFLRFGLVSACGFDLSCEWDVCD